MEKVLNINSISDFNATNNHKTLHPLVTVLDYSKATSLPVPDEDRFTKNILTTGFEEPIEMAILPNLDILVIQRKGEILFSDHVTHKLSQVAKLDVYHHATVPNVNAEEGVLGLSADPNYAKNNFIYIFYSPKDTSVNRLSRFTFSNGKFDLAYNVLWGKKKSHH